MLYIMSSIIFYMFLTLYINVSLHLGFSFKNKNPGTHRRARPRTPLAELGEDGPTTLRWFWKQKNPVSFDLARPGVMVVDRIPEGLLFS
jgi:hypothetical protein